MLAWHSFAAVRPHLVHTAIQILIVQVTPTDAKAIVAVAIHPPHTVALGRHAHLVVIAEAPVKAELAARQTLDS